MEAIKEVNLKVNDLVTFALQYLAFINPFNHLSDGEKEILARIMTSYSAFLEEDTIREKLLLDYEVKTDIITELDITEARLNNVISSLRKKGVIIKTKNGNKLHEAYTFVNIKLPFSLNIKWEYVQDKE
jgi:biotin operon repressor